MQLLLLLQLLQLQSVLCAERSLRAAAGQVCRSTTPLALTSDLCPVLDLSSRYSGWDASVDD